MASKTRNLSYRGEEFLKASGITLTDSDLLVEIVNTELRRVGVGPKDDLASHQFDALVSFVATVPVAAIRAADPVVSVFHASLPHRQHEVPAILAKWNRRQGVIDPDLDARRSTEALLWRNGNPQRLSPKLRMIANGDDEVNGYRALLASSVKSTNAAARAEQLCAAMVPKHQAPPGEVEHPVPEPYADRRDEAGVSGFQHVVPTAAAPEPVELKAPSEASRGGTPAAQVTVSCFVHRLAADRRDGQSSTPDGSIEVHELPIAAIDAIRYGRAEAVAGLDGIGKIAYVETGSALAPPKPQLGPLDPEPPTHRLLSSVPVAASEMNQGGDVLIGIIDVGGFDFAHPDFTVERADGSGRESRFHAIWDQGLVVDGIDDANSFLWETKTSVGEVSVPVGAVYSAEDLNQAIVEAAQTGLEARDFAPQSAEVVGSHATHVASIAAGNNGVSPNASIVGVTIAVGDADDGRRLSFYDSTRLGQAIDFIVQVAEAKGCPVAINISLGTNGHAHDGTSPINKWIEATLREQGRVVCVAAGNSGQETATYEGDVGYMSGRIHASGTIAAKDLVVELGWQVVGDGIVDVSENEMEIWYNPGDEFAVQVRSPSGEATEWVRPGDFLENWRSTHNTFLSIYSERFMQANGANRISLFLSPKYTAPIVGVQPGVWTVRLRGERVRDGRFDAWIERDDPRPVGDLGDSDAWNCPSFFTLRSNRDDRSVNSLGCGESVIAVANAEARGDRIHPTSSQGPTRDGRPKPDIAAPGTDIVAARGFGTGRNLWMRMTGTSMAAPYATGVAANMLRKEPSLTARQILGVMQSTAQPLPGSDYAWRDDAGFGVLDAGLCMQEMRRVFRQSETRPASPEANPGGAQ